MSSFLAPLPRSLILISGEDSTSFLQGLITQDITLLNGQKSLYSLLLTPQGRFLYDFFIIPANPEANCFFIECDSLDTEKLLKHLTLYKLRSKVNFNLLASAQIFAHWSGSLDAFPLGHTLFYDERLLTYQDPRLSLLGEKIISLDPSSHHDTLHDLLHASHEVSLQDYNDLLLQNGVPNGSRDMIPGKSIPLECGMEELNAISWTKGCYMGQELTARVHYQGLVRKRLIPGQLTPLSGLPLGSSLFFKDTEAGILRSSSNGRGLALLRLEFLETALSLHQPFQVYSEELYNDTQKNSGSLISHPSGTFMPYIPSWMALSGS